MWFAHLAQQLPLLSIIDPFIYLHPKQHLFVNPPPHHSGTQSHRLTVSGNSNESLGVPIVSNLILYCLLVSIFVLQMYLIALGCKQRAGLRVLLGLFNIVDAFDAVCAAIASDRVGDEPIHKLKNAEDSNTTGQFLTT